MTATHQSNALVRPTPNAERIRSSQVTFHAIDHTSARKKGFWESRSLLHLKALHRKTRIRACRKPLNCAVEPIARLLVLT